MTTSTKHVPVTETMTLRELADAVGVTMGSAYAWSSKGKLPAGTYRDDTGKLRIPRHRQPDRSSVGLGWIADEIGVPRRSLYYIINVVPLPDSAYYVGNEFRVPGRVAESWVREFCAGLGEDTPTARRTRRVWERAVETPSSSA